MLLSIVTFLMFSGIWFSFPLLTALLLLLVFEEIVIGLFSPMRFRERIVLIFMFDCGIEMFTLFLCSACTSLRSFVSGLLRFSEFSLLLEQPVESLEFVSEERAFKFGFLLLGSAVAFIRLNRFILFNNLKKKENKKNLN